MTKDGARPAAVADASPLIALASVGKLELLRDLFGVVAIPPAVWTEVVREGQDRPGATEVRDADWIRVVSLGDAEAARRIQESEQLERGESEAIRLADELGEVLLLIDEKRGRRVARQRRIRMVGTVGVLSLAARMGSLDDLKPCIQALRERGFRISRAVEERAVRLGHKNQRN